MKKMTVKEDAFYNLCDAAESVDSRLLGNYFPTVEELIAHKIDQFPARFLPTIVYFAQDPYKDKEMSDEAREEYDKTVQYLKKFISELDFV
ncbi:MAG: hypothetical protein J5525_13115 [Lachnospiraceae bacterium]|nr:hypothetical protein [Lachnospiraceae bacterium]